MKVKRRTVIIVITVVMLCLGGTLWYFSDRPTTGKSVNVAPVDRIPVRSYFMDMYKLHRTLEIVNYEQKQGLMTLDEISEKFESILREMEGSDYYNDFLPYISMTQKGEVCGAVPDENPIGGGYGYIDIIKKGKYNVSTADELVEALQKSKSGDVIFISSDAKIDMTEYILAENYIIKLKDGVTLASDRGYERSKGGMIFTKAARSRPMIEAGENVRITGLCIQGPDPTTRDWNNFAQGSGITTSSSNVTIDNCEISGFNYTSVEITGGENHHIHHNYIHHNGAINAGYAVYVKGSKALIEHNLFNYNRTSVAGDGRAGTGLEIRHNIEMGTSYENCIGMKAVKQSGNTVGGDYLKIYNNTFLTGAQPYNIQALPSKDMIVSNNYFYNNQSDYKQLYGDNDIYKGEFTFNNNAFGLYSKIKISVKNDDYIGKHTPEMMLTPVTSRSFYGDTEKVFTILLELLNRLSEESEDVDIQEYIIKAVREIEGYDRAYDFLEKPNFTINGTVYGAIPDDQPLGGGYGYKQIYTTGDYIVETLDQLIDALSKAKSGEIVFVKGDAVIDMTTWQRGLTINNGVTLASDRGNGSSPGALIFSDSFYTPMFNVGENVRISGISLRGADPESRIAFHARSFYGKNPLGSSYYYRLLTTDGIITSRSGLEVDNCELSGFSHAAISITGGSNHYFHHNYIHHNQRNGLGYGICHGKSVSLIEYNLFNYNRHDIAGTGVPGSGYEARHNLQMGASLSHCFDMHGGADRQDGSNIAGDTVLMHHNTFLSDKYPYWIRGIPQDIQDFYNNAVFPALDSYDLKRLYGSNDAQKEKFIVRDNLFNLKKEPVVVP